MKILENSGIKNYNSFRVDVKSRLIVEIEDNLEIKSIIDDKRFLSLRKKIVGEGSNLLFTKDFNGMLIILKNKGINIVRETLDNFFVKVAAGENWDNFVEFCVKNGWQGAENLSLIPGTVGASPVQNIGAYGVEAKDIIHKVEFVDLETKRTQIFNNADCKFEYRNSIFKAELKNKIIVTSVIFKLNKKPKFNTIYKGVAEELEKFGAINLENIRKAIIKIRNSKLPDVEKIPNAGSFFKNPIVSKKKLDRVLKLYPNAPHFKQKNGQFKIPAAFLIDKTGLKGLTHKTAKIFENQPLVIISTGHTNGEDIWELSQTVQSKVFEQFEISLEPEVEIV